MELTSNDFAMILESLQYTKRAFENYKHYPSYEFKRNRIKEVDDLILKIRQIQKASHETT